MDKKKFYIHYDKSTPNWAVSLRLKDFKAPQSIGAQIAVFNGHALHLNLGGYAGADRIAEALNKQLQEEEEEEDTTGESDEGKLMTSLDNQTSSDNPDNNISPIENPGSLFSNSSKATAELSNRVRRHLERVDERECSLDAWNCICDALGELE